MTSIPRSRDADELPGYRCIGNSWWDESRERNAYRQTDGQQADGTSDTVERANHARGTSQSGAL